SQVNPNRITSTVVRPREHTTYIHASVTIKCIVAKTSTARSNTIAFLYRSPLIRPPLDISRRRLDRTYSAAIRPSTLSPTPPPGLRLYTAIAIESRGGFHRARHRARHGPTGP